MPDIIWKNLINSPAVEVAEQLTARVISDNDVKDAIKFVRWLEPILRESPQFSLEEPELAERYSNFLNKSKMIALSLLSWEEVIEFFENNFSVVFDMPDYYDFWERIRVKLLAVSEYEERDNFKKRLREALLRNKEILSGNYLTGDGDKEIPANISNWLRSYIAAVGIAPTEAVKRSEYLTKNKDVQNLGAEERKKLEQLIAIFEQLKLSSLTPLGLEESVVADINDRPVVLKGGIFEPIDPEAWEVVKKMRQAGIFPLVDEGEKKKITEEYQTKEEEIIEKERQSIKQEWGNDAKKARDFLFSFCLTMGPTSIKPEKAKGLAVLSFLAENDALATLLNEDLRFKKDFTEFLKKEGYSNELSSLNISATTPAVVGRFLRYLLEKKLNIDALESPRYGVRLGNLMKKAGKPEYMEMAYYDMKEKKFKWKS